MPAEKSNYKKFFEKKVKQSDVLCFCRYECIENDLLGPLQFSVHNIAPYQSKGIEKAVELTIGRSSKTNVNQHPESDNQTNGRGVLTFLCLITWYFETLC